MDFLGRCNYDDMLPALQAVLEDLTPHILSFLDVPTLVRNKAVCRSWRRLFTEAVDRKARISTTRRAFQSNQELRDAVNKYVKYDSDDAEEFATTYGWPIDKWDVSNVDDFTKIFQGKESFNEPIGSWNVSHGTKMEGMFFGAETFHQDLSAWDTSIVTEMTGMFYNAISFNKDISAWQTSSVTDMSGMFRKAACFNQDISAWDTSSVTDMSGMFREAACFNQDISAWDMAR
eukprot:scaffold303839_cov48-Attheya_sp.AAC.1